MKKLYHIFQAFVFLMLLGAASLFSMDDFMRDFNRQFGARFRPQPEPITIIYHDNKLSYDDLKKVLSDNSVPESAKEKIREIFPLLPEEGDIEWYHVLGVNPDASEQEIKAAHRRLARQTHSDQKKLGTNIPFNMVTQAKKEGIEGQELEVAYKKGDVIYPLKDTTLKEIVTDQEKEQLAKMPELTAQWKRFYAFKLGAVALIFFGPELYKKLVNTKIDEWFQDTRLVKVIKKLRSSMSENKRSWLSWISKGGFFAAFGLYPLYKFKEFGRIAEIKDGYLSTDLPKGLRVFGRKKYSHTDRIANVRYIHYGMSDPLGYMNQEGIRKEFMPLRKAKTMQVFTWSSTIALLGALLLS